MFTILLHSSKTMRTAASSFDGSTPLLIDKATELAQYVGSLDQATIAKVMGVSPKLAGETVATMKNWQPKGGMPAIDAFIGDIYSGLQAATLTHEQRSYANESLVLLSGLYGIVRPFDLVRPYRVELGYKFTDEPFTNLYAYWADTIATALPKGRTVINTSSVEFTKAVFPHLENVRIITPSFMSISPKTGKPTFVTVHAKIARGAFARWLIVQRVEDEAQLREFAELGYRYDPSASTPTEPVFVAEKFEGLGLSVRLSA